MNCILSAITQHQQQQHGNDNTNFHPTHIKSNIPSMIVFLFGLQCFLIDLCYLIGLNVRFIIYRHEFLQDKDLLIFHIIGSLLLFTQLLVDCMVIISFYEVMKIQTTTAAVRRKNQKVYETANDDDGNEQENNGI
jgi:hypothetical protein